MTYCLRSSRSCRHMTMSFRAWSTTMYLGAQVDSDSRHELGSSQRAIQSDKCTPGIVQDQQRYQY